MQPPFLTHSIVDHKSHWLYIAKVLIQHSTKQIYLTKKLYCEVNLVLSAQIFNTILFYIKIQLFSRNWLEMTWNQRMWSGKHFLHKKLDRDGSLIFERKLDEKDPKCHLEKYWKKNVTMRRYRWRSFNSEITILQPAGECLVQIIGRFRKRVKFSVFDSGVSLNTLKFRK